MKPNYPLVLVHYINISELEMQEAGQLLNEIVEIIDENTEKYENILNLIVPIQNGENRVECINPQYLSEEKYEEIQKTAEDFKSLLERKISENLFT
jgi:hypothetical protein